MLQISQVILIQLRYNEVTLEPEFLNFKGAQEDFKEPIPPAYVA
jgi:hypothetical protein